MGVKCLVLGAGYATRLYPLTRHRPKPLLPIGGVPILERLLARVREIEGLDRVYVVSNHRFAGHYYRWLEEAKARMGEEPGIEIYDDLTTSNEDRLGAIGDIDFVIRHAKIADDLVVVAGDNLFDGELRSFGETGRSKGVAVGLKDLGSKEKVSLYGAVKVDAQGRMIDFEEKPPKPDTTLISLGLYYFRADRLELIDRYLKEGHSKDQPGRLIQWMHKVTPVHGWILRGDWYDIGDIDSYNRANEQYSG